MRIYNTADWLIGLSNLVKVSLTLLVRLWLAVFPFSQTIQEIVSIVGSTGFKSVGANVDEISAEMKKVQAKKISVTFTNKCRSRISSTFSVDQMIALCDGLYQEMIDSEIGKTP